MLILFAAGILLGWLLPLPSRRPHSKFTAAHLEMSNLCAAIAQYHAEFGKYPSGTKAEILKCLLGHNSKKLTLFTVNLKAVNSGGEFMDPWETPYEIQIYDQTNCTIRSAGPNHTFGDKDDILYDGLKSDFVKP